MKTIKLHKLYENVYDKVKAFKKLKHEAIS